MLSRPGGPADDLDTIYVLSAEGQLLQRSRAVTFVLRELGGGWRLLALSRWLPVFITDRVYNLVARVRYRLFGRFEACRLPTEAERGRIIGEADDGLLLAEPDQLTTTK